MKLQRFYVAIPITMSTKPVTIPSLELLSQLKRVLRLSPGDQVILFNKTNKQYTARIEEYTKDGVSFSILSEEENGVRPEREIWLFASVVKKDNFEWIVQKATELGVSQIYPIISARSEKKALNMDRLNKIAIEACEQSGRTLTIVINEVFELEKSLILLKQKMAENTNMLTIVFHTKGSRFDKVLTKDSGQIAVFIGPEGGWTEEEIEMFHKNGIPVRSLGPQILRAETAVVAALSQLVF